MAKRARNPHKRPTTSFRRDLASPVEEHPEEHFLTPGRRHRFRQVLARRSSQLAVVVEDCRDPHNATAVLRSAEAFGVHRVHVITQKASFRYSRRVSQGAHRYLDLQQHQDVEDAYAALRADDYFIAAAHVDDSGGTQLEAIEERLEQQRVAVVFGSEHEGLSPAAVAGADALFRLPMLGLTQSLNLSVTAAIVIWTLRKDAAMGDARGDLTEREQRELFDLWVRRDLRGDGRVGGKVHVERDVWGQPLDVLKAGDEIGDPEA